MTALTLPFNVVGRVIHGEKRGKLLGFPTANIDVMLPEEFGNGVYAGWVQNVETLGERHQAAVYWGTKPTFNGTEPVFEAFLLDHTSDLYGKTLMVNIVDFIREDRTFESGEALKEQISKDVAQIRQRLAAPQIA